MSFGRLLERAAALGGYLRAAGAGPETVVGLCLERGPEMVTAVLGVWLAGAAYLPLDPGWPAARLAFVLADARVALVAATAGTAGDLPAGRVPVIELDDAATAAAVGAAVPAVAGPVPAGRLAYVVYTSGSTGAPKGVGVTHGGLANYLGWVPGRLGWGAAGGRYGLLQGPVTDLGNTVVFTALATGGVLKVLDGPLVTDPGAVAGWLAAQGVDYLKVVPSHLAALAAGAGPGGTGLGALLPGRSLVLGGEAAAPGWAAELLAAAGDRVAVANHYGPTETAVGAAAGILDPAALAGGMRRAGGPVGRPGANMRALVLDQWLEPVPAGVTGELYLAGAAAGPRLPGPPGADGGAVPGVTRSGRRGADVPDRGPGPVDGGRGAGVLRAGR